jgi:hypothetical protein
MILSSGCPPWQPDSVAGPAGHHDDAPLLHHAKGHDLLSGVAILGRTIRIVRERDEIGRPAARLNRDLGMLTLLSLSSRWRFE